MRMVGIGMYFSDLKPCYMYVYLYSILSYSLKENCFRNEMCVCVCVCMSVSVCVCVYVCMCTVLNTTKECIYIYLL